MEYIKSFNEEDLCKLILETKESLFICLPLLHPKVIDAIDEMHYNMDGKVSIHIGIDFSPETFRQGYGEINSYQEIWMSEYKILNLKDNRISFVISDETGYYLFFESRYFIPAEKATLNAMKIDPVSMVRLKQQFFNAYKKDALLDHLANAVIEESIQLENIESDFQNSTPIISEEIGSKMIEKVEKDLSNNPPLKPDYKRIVDYYSNKFQYIKLEFSGANLRTKKVELPQKALPLRSAELKKRLETKLELFDKENSEESFKPLEDFKQKILELREKYLSPLTIRSENVIRRSDKTQFDYEFDLLTKEIQSVKNKIIEKMSEQIELTKNRLLNELTDFFIENPQEISSIGDLFQSYSDEYVMSEARNLANKTFWKINWPSPHELVADFKLVRHCSDITFEDLSNKDLIEEFKKRELITDADINNLAEFGKGIKID
ncbi:hypothetical protein HXX01_00035 [Candidatus Nomurabacteria bacterium]|nr:hypothetical protein [Candidatus Nomurabacteria bacterium]